MALDNGESAAGEGDPPLVPGVIHGLRRWQLYLEGSRLRLGALAQRVIWPADKPMEAVCVQAYDPLEEQLRHAAPHAVCGCGIYAFHPSAAAAEDIADTAEAPEPGFSAWNGWEVCGAIAAWGRVEVHETGFRAEHARPVALFVSPAWFESDFGDALRAIAEEYGVELVQVRGAADVLEACDEWWPGLAPSLIDDLLVSSLELTVVPGTRSLLLRDRTPVAGSGFLIHGEQYQPFPYDTEWKLEHPRVRVVRVAGTTHTEDELQGESFEPGRPLRLIHEPENQFDPDAIAIFDAELERKAGYVPRSLARLLRLELEAGRVGDPQVIWQWREMKGGRRIGLCALVPAPRLCVSVSERPLRRGGMRRRRR